MGKTSILEAIQFLSHGKSFKAERDIDAITENSDYASIEAKVIEEDGNTNLKVILAKQENKFSEQNENGFKLL